MVTNFKRAMTIFKYTGDYSEVDDAHFELGGDHSEVDDVNFELGGDHSEVEDVNSDQSKVDAAAVKWMVTAVKSTVTILK